MNSNLPDESSEAVLLRKISRKKIFDTAVRMSSRMRPECFQIAPPWRWPLLISFAWSGKCGNKVLRCLILQQCHRINLQKFLMACRGVFRSRFEAVCIYYVQLHWFQQLELRRFSCLTYLWWFFHQIDCLDSEFPREHPSLWINVGYFSHALHCQRWGSDFECPNWQHCWQFLML